MNALNDEIQLPINELECDKRYKSIRKCGDGFLYSLNVPSIVFNVKVGVIKVNDDDEKCLANV